MTTARRIGKALAVGVACGLVALIPALAEDTKGKWQFGFGLSYFATTDYIRSNSDIAIATSVARDTSGLPSVGSVDDRPDENMLNEPTIADDFRLDFNASYGLTRWLALEVAAGYMKSSVGDIEYYVDDRKKFIGTGAAASPIDVDLRPGQNEVNLRNNFCGETRDKICYGYTDGGDQSIKSNLFIPVGEITEIPVMLSALVRFRPESPLDPYIGLGIGYIYTDLALGDEFQTRSDEVTSLHVAVESRGEYTSQNSRPSDKTAPPPGFTPAPLTAEVSSGFEYHIVGGVDYYLSDRVSMYVDARYLWSDTAVDITIDDAHQVRMGALDLGKLQTFSVGSAASPSLWEDQGFGNCGSLCASDGLFATEDGNGNGTIDPGFGEGAGNLYFFPAGPNPNRTDGFWDDPALAVRVESCPACNNGAFDTEDVNGNRIMDRYLLWGVDVCTQTGAASNPICTPEDLSPLSTQHVWPAGCSINPVASPSVVGEGCPPTPAASGLGAAATGVDDQADIYLIQGGKISLGGFSLGVGVKFTF